LKKLIIFGTGLIAELAEFYFTHDSDYEVIAFTNGAEFISANHFNDKPLLPFEELEITLSPDECDLFVALGYKKTNQVRQARYDDARQKGYNLATYISSRACYFDTPVGDNCFILENNVIQPFVQIGNNVTLWSGNHIGHHSTIRNNVFISSHVVVSGACDIGDNCFLGVNSTLRDNIKLDRMVVVGSGALVMKNCEERTVVSAASSSQKVINRDLI